MLRCLHRKETDGDANFHPHKADRKHTTCYSIIIATYCKVGWADFEQGLFHLFNFPSSVDQYSQNQPHYDQRQKKH